ncbi:MAG: NAD(P)H-dependent oxidoreductase [Clostridia bacterium]|nr:NAD(P)H-dependent oxidoreductase [Clostridia bacterium]
MRILVLNGSPAGEESVTLETVLYLQKLFPKEEFEILHAGKRIKALERDFAPAKEALEKAELVLFAYPVYTFLVPSQLHRFLELIGENGVDLKGKWASQITTSKHFYDVTAHRFIRDFAEDAGMRTVRGLSADMEDLLKEKGRREAEAFFRHLLYAVRHGLDEGKLLRAPADENALLAASPARERAKKEGKRIVVVADRGREDERLSSLIDRFKARVPFPVEVVELRDFHFRGGCLGCFRCASEGRCFYKDGFEELLRRKIQTADAAVYAFRVRNHSMGSLLKLFDDRQFCNGHRTVTMGKPVGYLIDGAVSLEENLRVVIEARADVGGNYLAGIASTERDPDRETDRLAGELAYALEKGYSLPASFWGVGGMKIFRDLIYRMQGLMREDHRFYKAHGFYDFPQKKKGEILAMYLVGGMMRNEKLRKKIGGNMTKGMLMPYKAVIDKAACGK